MPLIKFLELDDRLKRKNLARFYYFTGEEQLLQDEYLGRIFSALGGPSGIEKEIIYGSETNADRFANAMLSQSLFSARRLLVIKETNRIKQAQEKEIAGIINDQPSDSGGEFNLCVVFLNPERLRKDRIKGSGIMNAVAKSGDAVEFRQLYKNEIIKFIQNRITLNDKRVAYQTAEYIHHITGNNLFDISNELEKLFIYTGDKKEITISDVDVCSGYPKQESIYQLLDALISRDRKSSIALLNKLVASGANKSYVLISVYRHYKRAFAAWAFLSDGSITQEQIYRKVGLDRYHGPILLKKIRNLTESYFSENLRRIYMAELALKSGRVVNSDLQALFIELCR
ncbi:MAG: DNA polymerase III subunit delta [Elusimicrobia bacterium]|nr:DNA polymerase III subunit delta [Elusimicrobiota bacterium]